MFPGLFSHVVFAISVENVLPTPIYRWTNVVRRVSHLSEQISTLRQAPGSLPRSELRFPQPTPFPSSSGGPGKPEDLSDKGEGGLPHGLAVWVMVTTGTATAPTVYSVLGTSRALSAHEKQFILPTLQMRKRRHKTQSS